MPAERKLMMLDVVMVLSAIATGITGFYLFSITRAHLVRTEVFGTMADPVELLVSRESTSHRIRVLLKRGLKRCGVWLSNLIFPAIFIMIGIGLWKLIRAIKYGSDADTVNALVWLIVPFVAISIIYLMEWIGEHQFYRKLERTSAPCAPSIPKIYKGEGWLPRKVYEGDSQSIHFSFGSSTLYNLTHVHSRSKNIVKKNVILDLKIPPGRDAFLEMEILAAGVEVSGEKKQRVKLDLDTLHFDWNCHFKNSGNHSLDFVLRFIADPHKVFLGRIEHTVTVVRLDHLTQRQVRVLGYLLVIVTGAVGLAEGIHQLGLW